LGLLAKAPDGLKLGLIGFLSGGLLVGLLVGLDLGLLAGLSRGGLAVIQHLSLRILLWRRGHIPLAYAHFLDYAIERIFLRKVGGGYIFIHRMLMEHFAEMEFEAEGE